MSKLPHSNIDDLDCNHSKLVFPPVK